MCNTMEELHIGTLKELDRVAKKLADLLEDHSIVSFSGELGAGKTTLIQALCRAMGVSDLVSSPTFALVNEYFNGNGESIYHFDLYRIEDPSELFDLGYEDYFFSGNRCFIEWPEKAPELIPDDAAEVKIEVKDDGSRLLRVNRP